jgi:hypothetical protein
MWPFIPPPSRALSKQIWNSDRLNLPLPWDALSSFVASSSKVGFHTTAVLSAAEASIARFGTPFTPEVTSSSKPVAALQLPTVMLTGLAWHSACFGRRDHALLGAAAAAVLRSPDAFRVIGHRRLCELVWALAVSDHQNTQWSDDPCRTEDDKIGNGASNRDSSNELADQKSARGGSLRWGGADPGGRTGTSKSLGRSNPRANQRPDGREATGERGEDAHPGLASASHVVLRLFW